MGVEIGEMYRRWTLDSIVDIAQAISNDFAGRYVQYRGVSSSAVLVDLRSRVGHDPGWPDQAQRKAIYGAFLGPSDGKQGQKDPSQFHEAVGPVLDAAVKYTARVFDSGEEALRRAFMDAVSGLQGYLTMIEGAAVEIGEAHTRNIFDASVAILRDGAVSSAFGLPPPGNDNWPLENSSFDGRGAYLVEEITSALAPQGMGRITRSRFVAMQRVANRGSECIRRVIQCDEDWKEDEQKQLINIAYSWATALQDLTKTDGGTGGSRNPSR